MTLTSVASSTKIITTGGTIGTLTQDRQTAVMGKLSAGPPMVPVDVTLETPAAEKKYHFEVIESPQLAPTLVAIAVYNGIIGSPVYGEGSTLELDGSIELKGHTPVQLEDRGEPFIQEIPITIPAQANRGTLQLAISDSEFLNRNVQSLAASSQGQLAGLEGLIQLSNRARHNERVYATLLQPTPTMLVEDKEMPNVRASAINVLDQHQNLGDARLLWQSTGGEWSVEMHQIIADQRVLAITVK